MLGIYHANVVIKSTGSQIYTPNRLEFLFVHWFTYQGTSVQWACLKLNSLRFLLVNSENAFGFVDPVNVLRGCHILPWFQGGRIHADGRSISKVANDKHDWCQYQVNWWVSCILRQEELYSTYLTNQFYGSWHTDEISLWLQGMYTPAEVRICPELHRLSLVSIS